MSFLRRSLFLLLCSLTVLASGSEQLTAPAASLRQMTRQSGYIFAGTVVSVGPVGPVNPNQLPVMRITFRVDQAIRGVRAGQLLEVRQWAGLWESGDRYHVGERLLLFLYPPSKLGLTSSVSGSLGRFAMNADGEVLVQEAQQAALSDLPLSGGAPSQPILKIPRAAPRLSSRDFARAIRRVEQ